MRKRGRRSISTTKRLRKGIAAVAEETADADQKQARLEIHAGAEASKANAPIGCLLMDKREVHKASGFLEDLKKDDGKEYNDKITEDGKEYRVPYRVVKEIVFRNVSKEDMIDIEHAARLQYRLMLMDAVLRAKVEFNHGIITIVYNNPEAENRKEKVSKEELIGFLAKEGVHVDAGSAQERDFDYYKEMYSYQFNPPVIRERPPYGYSQEEWKRMKPEWEAKKAEYEKKKWEKFRAYQDSYLEKHPELAAEMGVEVKQRKMTLSEKIFGKKGKDEKGFWFHGA